MPIPRVSWWYNLTLLDDSYDVLQDGRVQNSLALDKTEWEHIHAVLTCQALNSPFVVPKYTSVSIDLYLIHPIYVTLLLFQSNIEGNIITRTVGLRPRETDLRAKLRCRAANPLALNTRRLLESWLTNATLHVSQARSSREKSIRLTERGKTYVAIQCLAGSDGSLPQTFVAEVSLEGRLVANTSRSGTAELTVTAWTQGSPTGSLCERTVKKAPARLSPSRPPRLAD
ncbi:hypothetical protein J6590_072890 [Homalodisca vitripennis]|nr:hypothetical protein J6590_072890 [Homalodisca vitripennis]